MSLRDVTPCRLVDSYHCFEENVCLHLHGNISLKIYLECFSQTLLPTYQTKMCHTPKQTNKLRGLSPRANYTDRATAASRRSDCQLLRIKDATWSA
jgi:hypothetical protein